MADTLLYADMLCAAALTRLRAATATGQPLAGVYIPPTRHQAVPKDVLSAFTCYSPSQDGAGRSCNVPRLALTCTLHIDGFVAQGRGSTTDLDQAVSTLQNAILAVLLQDTSFLALFGFVERVNASKADVPTGKEAEEYDIVEFKLELVLAGAFTQFDPNYAAPVSSPMTDVYVTPSVPGSSGTPVPVPADNQPAQE